MARRPIVDGSPPRAAVPHTVRPEHGVVSPAPVLLGMAVLLVVANRWGQAILDDGIPIRILAPPLIGRFRLGPPGLLPILVPVVLGAALVVKLPTVAARARWHRLLLLGALAAAAWAVGLALVDGSAGLTRPMELPGHYLQDVGLVGSPGDFLRSFTDRIDEYGTHIRSHPPGLVLALWAMAEVGLGGSRWAAALVIAGGAAAVPAVLLTVRELAGEPVARRTLPFVVLAPAALYVASTGDALFAGVGAWAVATVVLATGPRPRRTALAIGGGALFGVAALLSYGTILLVLLPVVAAGARRQVQPLLLAAVGGAAVLGLTAAAGFWWWDGLQTTRGEYAESVASIRPFSYFLLANVAALVVVVGPAIVAGLSRLHRHGDARRLALVVGPALAMVAIANLSGLSKGEVERIWLPFAIWLLPAGALATGEGRTAARGWLGLQAATAIAVTFAVRTHW